MSRTRRIEELLEEADALEDRFKGWQDETGTPPDRSEMNAGARAYQQWFARAIKLVPEDKKDEFTDRYEGGVFITRIRGYLDDPLALNDFYDPKLEDNPFAPGRFRNPFETNVSDNLSRQRAILIAALEVQTGPVVAFEQLAEMFSRLPEFLHVLDSAGNDRVPCPTIQNEADLQVLVHAMLRLHYDDVRAEDYVSQQAGGSSRVDFLLRESGVIVETKMTRPTLTDKRVGEELLIDWGRYQRHPDCSGIFALVYDPGRHIKNVAGLTSDLSHVDREPSTRVLVVR